jgi:hypothetical protein
VPQIDAREPIVQVDIQQNAKGLVEIGVIFEGLRRWKNCGSVPVRPEQSLHCFQN